MVDSLEIKTDSPENVLETIPKLPPGIQAFLEVDCQSDPGPSLAAIARRADGGISFAKIRTGSVRADQIPTTEQVARFIAACAAHSIGFKATAGLHHPLRNEYRLTYDDNPPRAMLHGFLNVFVAALLAFDQRIPIATIEEILCETAPSKFSV